MSDSSLLTPARRAQSVAIVAPCYNEEANVETFYREVCAVLDTLGIDYRFIFVDDGSRDQTLSLLNRLANQDARVGVLSFARNFGHQLALTAGLDHAEADVIVTMDSDLQHPPSALPELIRAYENGADVVYGVRKDDATRGFLKRWAASSFYKLLKRVTRTEVMEGAVDYRLMSRQAVLALRTMREQHRYLRGMVPWLGFPHTFVLYEQQARRGGTSQYSWRQLARLARHGFFSFSTFPLELITLVGLAMTGLAGLYLLYILGVLLFTDIRRDLPGWTSVIVVSLVIGGVQLLSLGVMSQYLGMIFDEVKNRPLYVLKQKRLPSSPEEKTEQV